MTGLTLIIGNKNYSSWSLRPWLFMKHFRLDFTERRIALFTETTDRELAPWFSDGKVPVLLDGEDVVWDSLSILEYLSENYLDSGGWPQATGARAFARSVSAEMHSSFSNLRNELPMNCRKRLHDITLSVGAAREVERVKSIWRRCRADYGTTGSWLFGNFSIADAMYAPVALRFFGYTIPLGETEAAYVQTVLEHPDIAAWMQAGAAETEIIDMNEIEA
jgi:glutathione S-transferase